MRWAGWIVAACAVFAAGMGNAQAPSPAPAPKLALVIGNADYDGNGRIDVNDAGVAASEAAGFVPDLRNPLNDAADIRDALTRIGFRVDHVTNADGAAMSAALARFGTKVAAARDTAQVVVYYAGHAIQIDGANFLIPVNAKLPATDFSVMPTNQVQTILRRVAVSTTEITEQLKQLRPPGANLLIFDACRNNPWETRVRGLGRAASVTRGLAEISAPPRTVIAFATAPGRTASDGGGRNSPFAAALKTWVGKPGTILQTLDGVGDEVQTATGGRQTPWFQSASVGQVCLAECVAAPAIVATSTIDRAELPPPPAPKRRPGEHFVECAACPEMIVIQGGTFVMGSPMTEEGRYGNETQRTVTIRPFAAGRTEVTFAQWDTCVTVGGCIEPDEGPYRPDDEGWGRGDRPVINVSWHDARRYLRWLNRQVGGNAYRLLTEAEWEYGARAGTTTAFFTGASIEPTQAQFDHRRSFAGSLRSALGPGRTTPTGSFPANAFGLHDMHGNVLEWVQDCEGDYANAPTDGSAYETNCSARVFRGGAWLSSPETVRSAFRSMNFSTERNHVIGFRIARTL